VPFDLVAQAGNNVEEPEMGNSSRVAGFEFFAVAVVVAGEGLKPFGVRAQKSLVKSFEFDLLQVVNARGELAVPPSEDVLVNVKLLGNAGEAQVAGAEFDEFVFGFDGMHEGKGLNELNLLMVK
jgi:hypothetical protein